MTLPEKMYLAMVVLLFASFIVLMGTLSWLDAKDARLARRRERASAAARQPTRLLENRAASQH